MRARGAWALALAALASVDAAAEPAHLLRMASIAPDGTAWAHELNRFARVVETATEGAVRIKWYFGGIAGDDLHMGDRIRRDQLDGVASAGILCQQLAPSLRALRLVGLFQDREEASHVMRRLKPTLDGEFLKAGFVNLIEAEMGPDVLFTRAPVRSLPELLKSRFWIWDLDDLQRAQLVELGMSAAPMSLERAGPAYADGKIDGFLALPTAALAFQWSNQARFVEDVRLTYLFGCLVVATRAFDPLPLEAQQAVRAAAAQLQVRLLQVVRTQDDALLGGLFALQGLRPEPVSEAFRAQLFQSARAARERLGDKLVPRTLLHRVLDLLDEYRAERHAGEKHP